MLFTEMPKISAIHTTDALVNLAKTINSRITPGEYLLKALRKLEVENPSIASLIYSLTSAYDEMPSQLSDELSTKIAMTVGILICYDVFKEYFNEQTRKISETN